MRGASLQEGLDQTSHQLPVLLDLYVQPPPQLLGLHVPSVCVKTHHTGAFQNVAHVQAVQHAPGCKLSQCVQFILLGETEEAHDVRVARQHCRVDEADGRLDHRRLLVIDVDRSLRRLTHTTGEHALEDGARSGEERTVHRNAVTSTTHHRVREAPVVVKSVHQALHCAPPSLSAHRHAHCCVAPLEKSARVVLTVRHSVWADGLRAPGEGHLVVVHFDVAVPPSESKARNLLELHLTPQRRASACLLLPYVYEAVGGIVRDELAHEPVSLLLGKDAQRDPLLRYAKDELLAATNKVHTDPEALRILDL
mmetsp:Transcript_83935/g.179915  ORF Transcript_83935/g.179915 Transcript_83935/m.179915 type:complete len:309 (-) Transcript_83935:191-1117(-)